jgi:SAM-dependent methyltransferase
VSEAWNARARSFDARAGQYEDVRPSYPDEAIDEILRFGHLEAGARALEVGPGTGKATRLFLARGLAIAGLEPGPQLIEIARAACEGPVAFHNTSFEDWPLERGAYDLVFAAQSFHWVDQEAGYAKAGEALRTGGTLALFWNRPRPVPDPLRTQLDELYEERAPGFEELSPETLVAVEKAIEGRIAATELFDIQERPSFAWSERVPTRRYIPLLETYSAHAALPDAQRRHLLEGVAELVDAAGGEIEDHYETVIHLARRA